MSQVTVIQKIIGRSFKFSFKSILEIPHKFYII